jgi:CBS domain-containing protein
VSQDTDLLREHAPFAELDDAELDALVAASRSVAFDDGEIVLEEGGAPADALYVVRTGAIELVRDGEVLDVLGPGESFGFPSLLSGSRPALDVRASGATTCLRIPRETSERVLGSGPGLRYLAVGLRDRAALVERADETGAQRAIGSANDADALIHAVNVARSASAVLRGEGLDAASIGRSLARALDAATRRALELAISEHGDPGVPWAWLAFGSVARREPGLVPDQDHTIVWEGDASLDERFSVIAEAVTDVLARAGVPPCPSGVVATSPAWRGPVDRWTEALLTRRGTPAREAFRLAFALDARKLAGDLRIEPVLARLSNGVRNSDLLWRLVRLAVEVRPPVGALGGLLTERAPDGRRVVDLKLGGLIPVTDVARVAALRARSSSTETRQRLRDAADADALDGGEARALEEAFETFMELRLDRQIGCMRRGLLIDSMEEPATLDPVSRSRLRESFRVIDHVQERLRREVGAGRFG